MSKLTVTFGAPEAGWIDVTIQSGTQALSMDVSDVYNAFFPLVETLHQLCLAPGQRIVCWTLEPTEYDMHFSRIGEVVTLDVLRWPDSSRSIFHQEKVFSVSGSYNEICLPFWQALRGLQGRYSAAELETLWQDVFPQRELNLLTAALGKEPAQQAA